MMALAKLMLTWLTLTLRGKGFLMWLKEYSDTTCVSRVFRNGTCQVQSMNPQWDVLNPKWTFGAKPTQNVPNRIV